MLYADTGWTSRLAPYVAQLGHPAYVIDWAGHGRSPAIADLAHQSLATIARGVARVIVDTAWAASSVGAWPRAFRSS